MKPQLDFDALRSFDMIALHGGLGPASRATGRPKPTLSRHLAELEQALGVRLVERGERRLRLTEEGRRLHEQTHGLLVDLTDAAQAVASGAEVPRGVLRISAPVVLAHVALMPVVKRFCDLYPEVRLEVIAEDRHVDPVEEGYDLVLRIDPAPQERLVGRRIAYDRRLIVAAPALPQPSAGPEAEMPAVMLASANPASTWRLKPVHGGALTIRPQARLRLSSLLMVRDAVIQGMGCALLPGLLVQPDLDAGRLACWGEVDQAPVEIWALHPSRRLTSAKLRAFLAVLAEIGTQQG
ncbi:LysR family transcriptional regulator [Novosphingobium terrae]|uniref:LysR family transcriptional regulator n=1 Tax=Novosphingobium terrae TaxID=2726189 RepID=UPI001981DE77|nr:LysR family transcriptional regulator [Novosphingobium terrae]